MSEAIRQRDDNPDFILLMAASANFGLIITDVAGLTTWINAGFKQMCGFTLTELLGKKPGEVLQGPARR